MARILVVDDDKKTRKMLRYTLENAGYKVDEASNGNEAVALYRKEPADLVVLDIFMPEKDGIETTIELRRHYPDVKIIALSGGYRFDPTHYLNAAKIFGALHVFTKPLQPQKFLSALRELIPEKVKSVKS